MMSPPYTGLSRESSLDVLRRTRAQGFLASNSECPTFHLQGNPLHSRVMRLIADPPTAPGELNALAKWLRDRKHNRVGLELSDRCENQRIDGDVLRVSVTGTTVHLRVKGTEVMVPLEDITGIVI